MAIVDSLSTPSSPSNFDTDSSGDFHIILEFTYETGNKIELFARYDAWNDFGAKVEIAANGALQVGYNDGSYTQLLYLGSAFSDGVSYEVDFYGDGSEISVEVDGDEKTDSGDTTTHNEDVGGTDKGRITHDFDTNDIELESWPLGEPSSAIDLVIAALAQAQAMDAAPVSVINQLVIAELAHAVAMDVCDVDVVAEPIDLVIADLAHEISFPGEGGWDVGAYIYPSAGLEISVVKQLVIADLAQSILVEDCNVSLVGAVIWDLVVADMDHAIAMDAAPVSKISQLVVADMAQASSIDAINIEIAVAGMISLTIDANGLPIIYEGATPRITGSNSDVSDDDDVCVILDGASVSLFVNGSQIGSTYESLLLTTGDIFTMEDIGTAGATDSVELFPKDVSGKLPGDLT